MTWVHLANLKGPKGDVGPVNVGVSGVTAVGTALRFSFTDGRTPQDVNLPLATSTSAGLLSAADKARLYDSGMVKVTGAWPGDFYLNRSGNRVTVIGENIRPPTTGTGAALSLPLGYRPARRAVGSAYEGTAVRQVHALYYSPWSIELRGIALANSWVDFTISFPTADPVPESAM